ncbi:MAG: type I restriction enzyme HsdR N-terminal domain-containing protein [Chitinophagales bacterium]|nr:type I restriction enzyme HsdR N-terminal domain-containing protein [Chitinophagales bacterium]MDW8273407.1 type I restriction enzyme HsdR N-terminal domain-containing protein [Chitinophagales bacterium]
MTTKVIFPKINFKIQSYENAEKIFDFIRKKYVALTPEEWVRQHVLHYLVFCKNYPKSRMAIEYTIEINKLTKRCDVLAYDRNDKPFLLVECKAENSTINEKVLDQIISYNIGLNVRYLWISNGRYNFCFDTAQGCKLLNEIPDYPLSD